MQKMIMKTMGLLLALIVCGTPAGAQTAHKTSVHRTPAPAPPFWVSTYREALVKAGEARGMILVRQGGTACTTCSVAADKVLKDRALYDSLRQFCVAGVYLDPTDTAVTALRGAGFAYVLEDGTPLYRFQGRGEPTKRDYLQGLDQALLRKSGMQRLRILQAERMLGDSSLNNLEEIIAERNREGLPADSLLELYVEALPQDSLASLSVLTFLALQAPPLNSAANQLLRQDAGRFNEVWRGLPLQERSRINNQVISKTRARAVADGDQEEATLAATFAANTNANPTAKLRAFQGVMLEFYYGVADTARFLDMARTYYDRFLMPFNADSLRRQDSLLHRQDDRSLSRFVGTELETGAREVLALTSDHTLLLQAVTWADQAVALYPSREALETRARLKAKLEKQP
jgi:hypothetical protein